MESAIRHYLAQPVVMQLSEEISDRLGQALLNNFNCNTGWSKNSL